MAMKNLHPSIVVSEKIGKGFPVYTLTRGHKGVFEPRDLLEWQDIEAYVTEISDELWEEDNEARKNAKCRYLTSAEKEYAFFEFNPTW